MKYSVSKLLEFTKKVMIKAGLSEEESNIFSNSLISAEMRGVSSHGLTRLATYAKRVENGLVANHTKPEIIKDGGYDNSGILIKQHDNVCKIMFALDIGVDVVKRAKRLGCDTIITHHPAIYMPVSSLDYQDPNTGAVLLATKYGMNVISMHLNLDCAPLGIDYYLAQALGSKDAKIIEQSAPKTGYGREFCLNKTTFKGPTFTRSSNEM